MHSGMAPVDLANHNVPADFRALLHWCWASDPSDRPSAFFCSFGTMAMTDKVVERTSEWISVSSSRTPGRGPTRSLSLSSSSLLHIGLACDLAHGSSAPARGLDRAFSIPALQVVSDRAKRAIPNKQVTRSALTSWLGPKPDPMPSNMEPTIPSGNSRDFVESEQWWTNVRPTQRHRLDPVNTSYQLSTNTGFTGAKPPSRKERPSRDKASSSKLVTPSSKKTGVIRFEARQKAVMDQPSDTLNPAAFNISLPQAIDLAIAKERSFLVRLHILLHGIYLQS